MRADWECAAARLYRRVCVCGGWGAKTKRRTSEMTFAKTVDMHACVRAWVGASKY